jgi:hypothetical protein
MSDALTSYLNAVVASAALCREMEKRESAALDHLPHVLPSRGPWCADYGACRDEHPDYRASLAQLGMRIDERGRYLLTEPEPSNAPDAGWKRWCDAVR